MAILVSSRYHYVQSNPKAVLAREEVAHELNHLKRREQVSGVIALGALVTSFLFMGGIISGGTFILGALFAIAAIAAAYTLCCRQAESGLRDKQMTWFLSATPEDQKNIFIEMQKKVK